MPGLMITDGGPHSAEKWATMTGEHIFPIDPKVEGDRLIAAKRAQLAIIEALLPVHASNMAGERVKLGTNGDVRLDQDYEPEEPANLALAKVVEVLKGTPWQEKADDPEWQRIVLRELCTHFATAQNIERQWHCHRSKTPVATAWLAVHHPLPVGV